MVKKKTKKTTKTSGKCYLKPVVKKKHEAGWVSVIKIGVIAAIIYIILALGFGYWKEMAFLTLVINGIQVGVLIMIVIIFIVGLITISENTTSEVKKR